jgi:hypothetical protein
MNLKRGYNKMTECYFHIGIPKSGTSFLQKNFFPLLDLAYMGKHYDSSIDSKRNDREYGELFRILLSRQAYGDNRLLYASIWKKTEKYKKILYSNEELIGNYRINFLNNYQIAYHLKEIYKNPKLIFVIRRQDDFIESLYRQAIRNGYPYSLKTFINYKKGNFKPYHIGNKGVIDLQAIDYNIIYDFYEKHFGKENILILPYELMKNDQEKFLKKITYFLNVDYKKPIFNENTNRRDRYPLLVTMRIINKIIPKKIQNRINDIFFLKYFGYILNEIPYDKSIINKNLKNKIKSYYRESNKSLSEKIGLNLQSYDYY